MNPTAVVVPCVRKRHGLIELHVQPEEVEGGIHLDWVSACTLEQQCLFLCLFQIIQVGPVSE